MVPCATAVLEVLGTMGSASIYFRAWMFSMYFIIFYIYKKVYTYVFAIEPITLGVNEFLSEDHVSANVV